MDRCGSSLTWRRGSGPVRGRGPTDTRSAVRGPMMAVALTSPRRSPTAGGVHYPEGTREGYVAEPQAPRPASARSSPVSRIRLENARVLAGCRLPRRRSRSRPGGPVQRLRPRSSSRMVAHYSAGATAERGRRPLTEWVLIRPRAGTPRSGRRMVRPTASLFRRDSGAGGPSPLIRAILAAPGAVRSLRLRRGLAARPRRPRRHASVARARARRVARGYRLRVSRAARPHGGAGAPRPPSPTGRAAAPEPEPAPSAARCRSPAAARAPACATPRAPTVRSPVSSSLSIATSTHPGRANVGAGAPVPRVR